MYSIYTYIQMDPKNIIIMNFIYLEISKWHLHDIERLNFVSRNTEKSEKKGREKFFREILDSIIQATDNINRLKISIKINSSIEMRGIFALSFMISILWFPFFTHWNSQFVHSLNIFLFVGWWCKLYLQLDKYII